jgi:two-component system nitrate/nitrite sensor histidine kinase NarX
LQQTAAVLSSELNLDAVLEKILDQLHQVISFDSASIFMCEGDELVLSGVTRFGQRRPGLRLPLADQSHPATWVFHQRQSLVIRDADLDAQWKLWEGTARPQSWIGAPLHTAGEVIGVLVVESSLPVIDQYPAAPILEAFANHAAIAITNARLFSQARDAAAIEERNRLARELHDAVTQMLFSAGLIAEAIPTLMKTEPAEVAPNLEKLRQLTRGALAEMRTLLLELRPLALTEVPLERLLNNLKDAFTARTNIPIRMDVCQDCEVELPDDVKIAIYRIAQEALNNIGKHANAHQVSLRYVSQGSDVELVIQDDGRGFDQSQPRAGQLGLRMLSERAQSIGADLQISSLLGTGTVVKLSWQQGPKRDA